MSGCPDIQEYGCKEHGVPRKYGRLNLLLILIKCNHFVMHLGLSLTRELTVCLKRYNCMIISFHYYMSKYYAGMHLKIYDERGQLTIFIHLNIFWCKENTVMNEGHTIIIIH